MHSSARTCAYEGDTALHRAAYYGHGETVTALLRAGAHVDAKSWSGKTALCYAALSKEHVIVMELMKWGASVLPLAVDYAKCQKELVDIKNLSDLSDLSDDETDSE